MTHPGPVREDATSRRGHLPDLARRRPVTTFAVLAFTLGWPALAVATMAQLDPFLLVYLYGALLAPALLVTRWVGGPGAVRRLLSRLLIWRFGIGRWTVILFGVPALTIGLAAATGTLHSPDRGWAVEAGWYLVNTLLIGALLANIWEETAWGGVVQARLMNRHGLLVGSLLTAPLFAAIHVPMQLVPGWTWPDVAVGVAVVFGLAPFYRYLLGMHLVDTGGSLLAIGIQHAAWNEAGDLGFVDGDWQVLAAVVLLTLLMAVVRGIRPRPPQASTESADAGSRGTPRPRLGQAGQPG